MNKQSTIYSSPKHLNYLFLTLSFSAPYIKNTTIEIQISQRVPYFIKNYIPNRKIFHLQLQNMDEDELQRQRFVKIKYGNIQHFLVNLTNCFEKQQYCFSGKQHQNIALNFMYENLNESNPLYQKCKEYHMKIDLSEKQFENKQPYVEAINVFLRNQLQFATLFDKNEQIIEIKEVESEENKILQNTSNLIIKEEKKSIDRNVIIFLMIFFLVMGYFIKLTIHHHQRDQRLMEKNKWKNRQKERDFQEELKLSREAKRKQIKDKKKQKKK